MHSYSVNDSGAYEALSHVAIKLAQREHGLLKAAGQGDGYKKPDFSHHSCQELEQAICGYHDSIQALMAELGSMSKAG